MKRKTYAFPFFFFVFRFPIKKQKFAPLESIFHPPKMEDISYVERS